MNISLPMIRQVLPTLVAQDIVGVQPMVDGAGEVFKLRHCIDIKESVQGGRRHSFTCGWQRYYGTQWIPEHLWINLKIRGL